MITPFTPEQEVRISSIAQEQLADHARKQREAITRSLLVGKSGPILFLPTGDDLPSAARVAHVETGSCRYSSAANAFSGHWSPTSPASLQAAGRSAAWKASLGSWLRSMRPKPFSEMYEDAIKQVRVPGGLTGIRRAVSRILGEEGSLHPEDMSPRPVSARGPVEHPAFPASSKRRGPSLSSEAVQPAAAPSEPASEQSRDPSSPSPVAVSAAATVAETGGASSLAGKAADHEIAGDA